MTTGSWSGKITECFTDVSPATTLLAVFAPCVIQGRLGEALGGNCLLHGFLATVPLVNMGVRTYLRLRLRQKEDIDGFVFGDFVTTMCCPSCSLIQEYKQQGLNASDAPSSPMAMSRE